MKRVTFHRMTTGVEDIMMLIDDDVDIYDLSEADAELLVGFALEDNTAVVDHHILENELLPHAVTVKSDTMGDDIYVDFSTYYKENG
jgi:hypothetical protein